MDKVFYRKIWSPNRFWGDGDVLLLTLDDDYISLVFMKDDEFYRKIGFPTGQLTKRLDLWVSFHCPKEIISMISSYYGLGYVDKRD